MPRKRTSKHVPAKGRLRDMADQLWSLAIRADWNHRCAVCGAGKCEAHHLAPRQLQATRYDLRNGIALCSTHHQFDRDMAPHQNAAGWMEWLGIHHPERLAWYVENHRTRFDGTTNATYYLDQITRLRQYVDEIDFNRVVGCRLADHLESLGS